MVVPLVAAALLAGGAQAGVAAYGAQKQKQAAKKAKKLQKRQRATELQLSRQELGDQETDTYRSYNDARGDLEGGLNKMGLVDSGYAQTAQADLDYDRDRRLRAIQRARVRMESGYGTANALDRLEEKLQRTQRNLALINGFLGAGASGVAAAL